MTMVAAAVCVYAGCGNNAPDLESLNVLECDLKSGAVKVLQTLRGFKGTTYFQLSADGKYLYTPAGNVAENDSSVWMVRFKVEHGRLGAMEKIAKLPCEAPCHVELSPDGKTVAFAAYLSGTVGLVPVDGGGAVLSCTLPDVGMGPNRKRQLKAYAHFAFFLPSGDRVGFIDLGCDKIHFFETDGMTPVESMTITADPGDGPRHAVWSKDRKHLFVVNELSSSVTAYAFNGDRFSRTGKWSMLPAGYDRFKEDGVDLKTKAAAIKLTEDGKILMASNRGHDSIAFFAVDGGSLTLKNIAPLKGEFPRDFELLPGEEFMIVGHKMSNEIQMYRFDRGQCTLTALPGTITSWRPLCFKLGGVN